MDKVVDDLVTSMTVNAFEGNDKESQQTIAACLLSNAIGRKKWIYLPEEQINRFALRLWLRTEGNFYWEEMKRLLLESIESEKRPEEKEAIRTVKLDEEWLNFFFRRELLKTDGTPLKGTSMNQYKSRAKDLVHAIEPINDMRDMESIFDKLLKVEDVVKRENHLNCLKVIFRNLTNEEIESLMTMKQKSEVEKLLDDFTKAVMAQKKEEENDQIPSEEEQKHYIPWNELNQEVLAYRDRMLLNVEDRTTEELENACITALYVIDHEPRRNEYGSLMYDEMEQTRTLMERLSSDIIKLSKRMYEFALSDETKVLMDDLVRRKKQLGIKGIFGENEHNPRDNWHTNMRKAFNAVSEKPLISRYL
ncbi:hypothetical protein HK104_005071 [Borealophlyctis nickersoniae]|nr:hypothetical protein HK104_005071 [Borealophlyctis nickersoniae]